MEIEQKCTAKRSIAYKEIIAPENKENHNNHNMPRKNTNNMNNTKKAQIKSKKPLLTNTRYFETQAEKMGFIRKDIEKCGENPQKNQCHVQAQNFEARKANTSRANLIKIDLKPSETEKENFEQTEILLLGEMEPKEIIKTKNSKAKLAKRNLKTAVAAENNKDFDESRAAAKSKNFSLNKSLLSNNNRINSNDAQVQGNTADENINTNRNWELEEIAQKADGKFLAENCVINNDNNNTNINNNKSNKNNDNNNILDNNNNKQQELTKN